MRNACVRYSRSFGLLLFALVAAATARAGEPNSAILFIGDGMGLAQVTAARIYQKNARDGHLAMDDLDHTAVVRTYASNKMVTDSGAAGTALASGVKTYNGAIGVDAKGEPVPSMLDLAKAKGKSVGVVTTTTVTHATPACFYAHVKLRAFEPQIALQLVERGDLDVVMGGGRGEFTPKEKMDPENNTPGDRTDGRDLIKEALDKGYRLVRGRGEFDAYNADLAAGKDPGKLLAMFGPAMMAYELDRPRDAWGEPSLAEMTATAIKVLSRNPKGYVLMVEGGRIDHACHDNRAKAAIAETLAFDGAVRAGVESLKEHPGTLVIVTADHETGGLAINGYPDIEIGGDALLTTPVEPGNRDILTFATGHGAKRPDSATIDKAANGYRQPAIFDMDGAAHTGVDVIAWATGPGAEAIHGTLDNTDIARIIIQALGLR